MKTILTLSVITASLFLFIIPAAAQTVRQDRKVSGELTIDPSHAKDFRFGLGYQLSPRFEASVSGEYYRKSADSIYRACDVSIIGTKIYDGDYSLGFGLRTGLVNNGLSAGMIMRGSVRLSQRLGLVMHVNYLWADKWKPNFYWESRIGLDYRF